MLYALACILCSTAIVLVFRALRDRPIRLLPVITVNYWVCVGCGLLLTPDYFQQIGRASGGWLPLGLAQGTLFISLFFLIGWSAQRVGVAYTAVVTRVSVVFPALASVVWFGEAATPARWGGLVLALAAVLLLHLHYFRRSRRPAGQLPLGVVLGVGTVLFFGSGTTDTLFKLFDHRYADQLAGNLFTITLFGVAGSIGLVAVAVQVLRGRERLNWRHAVAGLALGLPNYASILFLLLALRELPGLVFYPLNNIGILVASSLVGVLYFREPFPASSWAGLGLAIVAIAVLAWGS